MRFDEPPAGTPLGNGSGHLGQNLMFHYQTNVNGFAPERIHGQRGRAVRQVTPVPM